MFYSHASQKQSFSTNSKRKPFFTGSGADIKEFDKNYIGQNFNKDNKGFFFTTCTAHEDVNGKIYEDGYSAGAYAKNAALITNGSPVVYPVYLDIKKPLVVDDVIWLYDLNPDDPFDGCHPQDFFDERTEDLIEFMEKHKRDGVLFEHHNETFAMVFEPEQIEFALLQEVVENV